ncbi:MAG: hypothetical protein V3R56_03250 [Xanthomonadales bacterium]
MKTGTLLAIIVFTIVAVAHLLRLVDGTQIVVGNTTIPMWVSFVGVLAPGLIAFLLWKETRS